MTIEYGPRIVTDGLVLALDAADRNSYPGSGTSWSDLSAAANNGTLTNGPTFNSGNSGSIVFDGTDDYISVPNTSSLNPGTGSFTIMCWVNTDPSNAGDTWDVWVAKRSSSNNGYYIGVNNPAGARFVVGNDQGTRVDTGYVSYTSNTWAMFTGVLNRNANTQTIIRNNYDQTATVTPAGGTYSNATNLFIGADVGLSAFYTNGKISYVMIYNKALSANEISQNFNATRSRFGI
jgi:hypothetical protein